MSQAKKESTGTVVVESFRDQIPWKVFDIPRDVSAPDLRDAIDGKISMAIGCLEVITAHSELRSTAELNGLDMMAWGATVHLEEVKAMLDAYASRLRGEAAASRAGASHG